MEGVRELMCRPLHRYYPPVYQVAKEHPAGVEERRVVDYYENATVLHVTSLACLLPNVVFWLRYRRLRRELFADVRPVLMRMLSWTGLGLTAYLGCLYYDAQRPVAAEAALTERYRRELRVRQEHDDDV